MEKTSANFRKIREEDLEIIMRWRMAPNITKFMTTDPKLTIEKQYEWFEKIQAEEDTFYWIFEVDSEPSGLVSLTRWDKHNSIIRTGAYIAEKKARTLQNIVDMNMNLFCYAMETLKVNKLTIDVLSNNKSQIQWAKRVGATQEGILRQEIKKNGEYYDVYLLSILSDEWEGIKNKISFNKFFIEE